MAENSLREQIILAVKAELETLTTIKKVKRTIPTIEELKNFAITQFPVVAIVAGLPVPTPHVVGRRVAGKDVFLSDLTISIYCYFQDNVNPDSTLSSLLDDLWAKLYSDPTKGGLTINTTLKPTPYSGFWRPFYAFKLDCIVTYKHLTGGI